LGINEGRGFPKHTWEGTQRKTGRRVGRKKCAVAMHSISDNEGGEDSTEAKQEKRNLE